MTALQSSRAVPNGTSPSNPKSPSVCWAVFTRLLLGVLLLATLGIAAPSPAFAVVSGDWGWGTPDANEQTTFGQQQDRVQAFPCDAGGCFASAGTSFTSIASNGATFTTPVGTTIPFVHSSIGVVGSCVVQSSTLLICTNSQPLEMGGGQTVATQTPVGMSSPVSGVANGTTVFQLAISDPVMTDPDPADNTYSLRIRNIADLSATVAASTLVPPLGGNVTLTLTLANEGPDPASTPTALIGLPTNLAVVSAPAEFDIGSSTWNAPSIPAAGSAALEIIVAVTSPDAATVAVSSAEPGGGATDPTPCGSTCATVGPIVAVVPPQPPPPNPLPAPAPALPSSTPRPPNPVPPSTPAPVVPPTPSPTPSPAPSRAPASTTLPMDLGFAPARIAPGTASTMRGTIGPNASEHSVTITLTGRVGQGMIYRAVGVLIDGEPIAEPCLVETRSFSCTFTLDPGATARVDIRLYADPLNAPDIATQQIEAASSLGGQGNAVTISIDVARNRDTDSWAASLTTFDITTFPGAFLPLLAMLLLALAATAAEAERRHSASRPSTTATESRRSAS